MNHKKKTFPLLSGNTLLALTMGYENAGIVEGGPALEIMNWRKCSVDAFTAGWVLWARTRRPYLPDLTGTR